VDVGTSARVLPQYLVETIFLPYETPMTQNNVPKNSTRCFVHAQHCATSSRIDYKFSENHGSLILSGPRRQRKYSRFLFLPVGKEKNKTLADVEGTNDCPS